MQQELIELEIEYVEYRENKKKECNHSPGGLMDLVGAYERCVSFQFGMD